MTGVGLCVLSTCIAVSPLLALKQESRSLPTESDLQAKPGQVRAWSERLSADDQKVREKAAAAGAIMPLDRAWAEAGLAVCGIR